MRALFLILLAAVAAPDRQAPMPKEKAKPIQEQLLGDWQLVNTIMAGRNDKKDDAVLTFTPTEIHITERGKRQERDDAVYTIDATKKPMAIDITPKGGRDAKIIGIFKVEGDQMTLCFQHGGGGMRPTDFVSTPESPFALLHFKRIKK